MTLGLAGCDAAIGAGPGTPTPVIQSLLVGGDSLQIARVEWRVPADSPFQFTFRPVDSTLVQLSLVQPGGGTVPFRPSVGPGTFSGTYTAAAVVSYRATYKLAGTVAGHAISATVVVPDTLRVFEPAQDTVRISSSSCGFYCALGFHWFAAGADQYQYLQTKAGAVFELGSTADTSGVIALYQVRPSADTTTLVVYALDAQAAAFLLPETPKGSVTGVFGFFGAASRGRRVLVWQ